MGFNWFKPVYYTTLNRFNRYSFFMNWFKPMECNTSKVFSNKTHSV